MGDTGLEQPPQTPEETAVSSTSSPTSSPTVTPANLVGALQALASLSSEQLAAVLAAVVQPQARR